MTVNWDEIYEHVAPGVDWGRLSDEEREIIQIKALEEYSRIIKEVEKELGEIVLI
jgi:hypothetical protein